MMAVPKNIKIWNAIQQVVLNVSLNYYGNSPLDPTGPVMFGKFFCYDDKKNSVVRRYVGHQGNGISICDIIILDEYKEYRDEQMSGQIHYNKYWRNKDIYF